MPTVRRHKPLHWVFLMCFHIALLLLIIGHLELFEGFNVFQFIPHEIFMGKGFVGLVLSLTLLFFLFRRFASPVRDLSVPEDYYLLNFVVPDRIVRRPDGLGPPLVRLRGVGAE